MSKTLFSYFKPVQCPVNPPSVKPPTSVKVEQENEEPKKKIPVATAPTTSSCAKTPQRMPSDEDTEEEIGKPKNLSGRPKRNSSMSIAERRRKIRKKRSRVLESDDEEDDEEYKSSSLVNESLNNSSLLLDESIDITPVKKTPRVSKTASFTPLRTPSCTPVRTPNASLLNIPTTPSTPTVGVSGGCGLEKIGSFSHDSLDFLKDSHRKDKNGKKVNDPEFNPRTVFVPSHYLSKLTPALRQWWNIKSDNFDTILFFKVGKFYELYHMDAVIGVKELKLVFMKGDFAHAGFPEKAFGRYSQTLVQKGYRIARVEQTETPSMMEERIRKMTTSPSRFDKVVQRELCSLTTKGTRTLGFFEGEEPESESAFLLAIKENCNCSQNVTEFGVCFLDTCIGLIHLGQFKDDRHLSRLRTLLAHYPPVQVLMERGNLSYKVQQLINQVLSTVMRDTLSPGTEFWDTKRTLQYLIEEGHCQTNEPLPHGLHTMISTEDCLGLNPVDGYELAISSLGACIWTLKRSLIDNDILQLKQFQEFVPVDEMKGGDTICHQDSDSSMITASQLTNQRMVLDGITLINLDVIDNFGHTQGTLLQRVDHTSTPFGRRLLKEWLSAPLCNVTGINERLDAVTDLIQLPSLLSDVKDILKSLPDLERLLRRVHALGSKVRGDSHPDSRAIFYESLSYNKKKINDFLSLLEGLEKSLTIVELFSSHTLSSKLLTSLVTLSSHEGQFPNMDKELEYFKKAFDHKLAREKGAIVPFKGVSSDYDESLEDIESIEEELQEYLLQQKKALHCKSLSYWGNGRNKYQIEVPDTIQVPDEYRMKSQRKGFFRYWTDTTEDLLSQMTSAEERRDTALTDTMRALFHSFGQQFTVWDSAIQCIAVLDVLVSMATYSMSGDGEMCRPVVTHSEVPYLDIIGGRHPCVNQTFSRGDFIPNDVTINRDKVFGGKMCTLVTGPNMGGKSTLLRQTGLIVILAQMGCYVPAQSCSLSPVDRIFTRLGASDRIMHGESTFFVEVSETSVILHHSTLYSLILLDELGRGTATYDGTAIATSVVKYISEKKQCRTLFSTHYHGLVDEFKESSFVQLGHMSCMVEDEEDSITFLYKFVEGACPKSYGFNAAKLAGLPQEIIDIAKSTARDFEKTSQKGQLFRKLLTGDVKSFRTQAHLLNELY